MTPATRRILSSIDGRRLGSVEHVRELAHQNDGLPKGLSTLPPGLTDEQLEQAPVLPSADLLVMHDLTAEEFEAFHRPIDS